MKIETITIRVDVSNMDAVNKYSLESTLAYHPDAKQMIKPQYAEVVIAEGTDVDTHIYGRRVTKSGTFDARLHRNELIIGHFNLERQIGQSAVMLARKLTAETRS